MSTVYPLLRQPLEGLVLEGGRGKKIIICRIYCVEGAGSTRVIRTPLGHSNVQISEVICFQWEEK